MKTDNMIFVFGSNEAGMHGAGAARFAMNHRMMPYGKSYGHYGQAFAIPTKDERIQTISLGKINSYIEGFIAYAVGRPKLIFQVTAIGCGLAGYKNEDIAPLFSGSPKNVYFDTTWKHILGDNYNYWGTFGG